MLRFPASNNKFINSISVLHICGVLVFCAISQLCLVAANSAELKLSTAAPPRGKSARIVIDRKLRHLTVSDASGQKLYDTDIGIGRGGLGKKKTMEDCITPSGVFKVDLVLYRPPLNAIDPSLLKRYDSDSRASEYLKTSDALQKLFSNMNSIDFNGDSKPDTAYGVAYVGLTSPSAVTGPKLSSFNGITYWFSIALHGTSNEKRNIGFANSGGCLQIPESVLKPMIEKRILRIGSEVIIN